MFKGGREIARQSGALNLSALTGWIESRLDNHASSAG
jgi:hypothetical protein